MVQLNADLAKPERLTVLPVGKCGFAAIEDGSEYDSRGKKSAKM
jgi:hypothetical protein